MPGGDADDGAGEPWFMKDGKGLAIVLTEMAAAKAKLQVEISALPWKRCLSELESGATAITLHATNNEERAQKFLVSKPYYSISSALYYQTKKYPVAPKIASVAEMKPYRYCGLSGYNYTMYDLPEAQLDTGAKDEASRFAKLKLDRCDFVLGDVEILKGFASMGLLDLSGTGHIPIPGAKPKEFHVMVSRTSAGGEKMLKVINDGITALTKDKTYAKIFKKYGI